jgi:hypothetical protein
MGTIGCPETSVNYQPKSREFAEKRLLKLQSAGRLLSKRIISRFVSDCLKLVFVLIYLSYLSFSPANTPNGKEAVALYSGLCGTHRQKCHTSAKTCQVI